jgi:hypothetical protein
MAISRPRTNVFTKKRVSISATPACAICGERLDTAAADATGKYWCQDHAKRGRLLDWAAKHNYPAIRFTGAVKKFYPVPGLPEYIAPTKYAIGFEGDKESRYLWEINIFQGCNDVIDAAIAYIDSLEQERAS